MRKDQVMTEEQKEVLRWSRALQPSTIIGTFGVTSESYNRAIEAGLQWCRDCKSFQEKDKFYGKDPRCKECGKARIQKVRDRLTPEQRAAAAQYFKDWRAGKRKPREKRDFSSSPEVKADRRKRRCLRAYGVTPEWYDAQLAKQGGHCYLCSRAEAKGNSQGFLHIDHDHVTGKVRGLLCHVCNVDLGRAEREGYDEWYQRARQYSSLDW